MKKTFVKFFILFAFIFSAFALKADKADDLKPATKCSDDEYCTVILGGGVGALTSAIYLSRAGYHPVVIEGNNPGGLITQSHSVENWPGEVKISGSELVDKIRDQAKENGCIILSKEVVDVDFSKNPFVITVKDLYKNKLEKIKAKSCIIAMGTTSNYLNIAGEKEYWGKGVSNCAVCDGSLYQDKSVVVVGGGDSAVLEANYLSNIAKDVYVVVRKESLNPKDKDKLETLKEKSNIKIINNTVVESVIGKEDLVNSVKLKNITNDKVSSLNVDGVFLAIGSNPNTKIFKGKLDLDENGYIKVKDGGLTSIKGVYAIGDIVDPIYKQAITAAGDGAKAAISAQKHLDSGRILKNENKDYLISPVLSSVINISSSSQFESEVLNTNIPVIVDFYATWCKPCQRLSPVLDSASNELKGKVKIVKVNIESNRDLAQKYKISAMPTAVIFDKSGKMLYKKIGPNEIGNLLDKLEDMKDKPVNDINNFLMNN